MLDTHVLIWWVADSRELSQIARTAIESELSDPDGLVIVSSISVWEIALLVRKERLRLNIDLDNWLDTVEQIEACDSCPWITKSQFIQRGCPESSTPTPLIE